MFVAHVTPFYPKQLAAFPAQLTDLITPYFLLSNALRASKPRCTSFDSSLMNRKSLVIEDILALFLDIQTLGDKSLQKIVISMLEQEDEAKAKRALVTLCAPHKDNIWLGDKSERVAIAICEACFHTSPSIMISALGFLLGYESIDDDDNNDAESDDDKETKKISLVVIDRAAVYKKFAERLCFPLQTVKGTGGRVEVILPVFISKI